MKRKLELRDVAGYIPYEFKGFCCDKKDNSDTMYYGNIVHIGLFTVDYYLSHPEKCKPILRPLSDLYKTITHNGKEIIPIVELAKMSLPLGDWIINQNYITDYCFSGQYGNFGFKNGSFWVEDIDTAPDQYQLFDYLHELKIDYRGLIEAGLAIDVNTLNENPYK